MNGHMAAVMVTFAVVGLVPYTLASWAAADGLPLFSDWHYWAGVPVVMCLGAAAGWLITVMF